LELIVALGFPSGFKAEDWIFRDVTLLMDGPVNVSKIGELCSTCVGVCRCEGDSFKTGVNFTEQFAKIGAIKKREVKHLILEVRPFAMRGINQVSQMLLF